MKMLWRRGTNRINFTTNQRSADRLHTSGFLCIIKHSYLTIKKLETISINVNLAEE